MKAPSLGNKFSRGVSTLEILIAAAILTLSLTAIITVIFGNQSLGIDTQTNNEAIAKAQELIEQARAKAREDFSSSVNVAPSADDIYTKSLAESTIDSSNKQITSYVTWPAGGRNPYVQFSTIITNWTHPANKCVQTLTGNWVKPQTLGFFDFPSSAGATGVYVAGKKVYVTSDPTSAQRSAKQKDFYIVDARNPLDTKNEMPEWSSFDTGYGLTSVIVKGLRAFVTADSQVYQVLSIDISDYAHMDSTKIKKPIDLTSSTDDATGKTLTYADGYIYVGLTKSPDTVANAAEFRILDASDPDNPTPVGSGFRIRSEVNSILINGDTAYLATASSSPLIALDISDRAHPHEVDSYDIGTYTGQSLSLSPDGSTLYFGQIGGGGTGPRFLAFDPDHLSTPKWSVSSKYGAYTMVPRNKYLFRTTADPNAGFDVIDATNATTAKNPYGSLNIQQASTAGADCSGNYIYVGQRSNRALQVVGPS